MKVVTDIVSSPGQEEVNLTFGQPNAYVSFLHDAERAVADHLPSLIQEITHGGVSGGAWHPNGFATFRIRLDQSFGLIRFHVWPKFMRHKLPGHPEVHCHSFDLYSRVVAGTYIESQYSTKEIISRGERTGLKEYTVQPSDDDNRDVLIEGDTWTLLERLTAPQAYPTGSWHDLAAGVYHATEISDEMLCATLAVLGKHHPSGSNVLVGQSGFPKVENVRAPVTNAELAEICSQLQTEMTR